MPPRSRFRPILLLVLALFLVELPLTAHSMPLLVDHVHRHEPDEMILAGLARAMTTVEGEWANSPLPLFAPVLASPAILSFSLRCVRGGRTASDG